MNDEEYADWCAANGAALREGLRDVSARWLAFADTELAFYQDLRNAVDRLG